MALRHRKNAVAPVATNIKPTSESNAHNVEFEASRIVASSAPMHTAQADALTDNELINAAATDKRTTLF